MNTAKELNAAREADAKERTTEERMIDVLSGVVAVALVLGILWMLGLLPRLIDGLLFPFLN